LIVVWSIPLFAEIANSLAEWLDLPTDFVVGLWINGGKVAGVVVAIITLWACLRGETIQRIFTVGRRPVLGVVAIVALWIVYGVISNAAMRGVSWVVGRIEIPVVARDLEFTDLSSVWKVILALLWIVLGATAEECLYRGVVYETFACLSNRWIGGILSSALFAAIHVVPVETFVVFTLFGLLAVYLRERTASLFLPVLVHVLQNMVATLAHSYH